MSFNRRRNIYTLGDFHLQQNQHTAKAQQSRRQNSDPFERDPFKIQSYNFHYADRPTYPLSNLVRQVTAIPKPFETHYYNHDFTISRNDKENSTTNKFHEFRRRKFLLNHQQVASTQQHDSQHQHQRLPSELQDIHQHRRTQHSSTAATTSTGTSTKSTLLRSAADKPAMATTTSLLRSGTNRECLQGLRTFHSPSPSNASNSQQRQQQRQGSFQRSNSFTRSSSSRVSLADSATGLQGPRRLQRANTFITSYNGGNSNNNTNANININPKSSSSAQNSRSPLQTVHVSSHNLPVNGNNSCTSGCQINIRIRGLDDKMLGENVTIKIESELSPRKQATKPPTQQLPPQVPIAPEVDVTLKSDIAEPQEKQDSVDKSNSSDTIIINKRISKFSVSEGSSTHNQTSSTGNAVNPLKGHHRDRLPGMVPWVLSNGNRTGFDPLETNAPDSSIRTPHSSLLRRIRNNYNAGLDDIKQLREKAKCAKALTSPLVCKPMTPKLAAEHKLLNTVTVKRKIEPLLTTPKYGGAKRQSSHLSLRNNIDRRNINTSPDNCMTQSRSSYGQFQRSVTSPLIYHQTRRPQSPVSVNINVYADKLKLLRV